MSPHQITDILANAPYIDHIDIGEPTPKQPAPSESTHQQSDVSIDEALAMIVAEAAGWNAFTNRTAKAPAQCKTVMALISAFCGQTRTVIALLDAWKRGQVAASLAAPVAGHERFGQAAR